MFGFKKPSPVDHPRFGRLERRKGKWRGSIQLPGLPLSELSLPGDRTAPDSVALSLADEFLTLWPALRHDVAQALYDHYLPYREAQDSDDMEGEEDSVPDLEEPDEVWQHVTEPAVAIRALGKEHEVLVGLQVAWDEEHTLGATIRDGELVELSGSIGRFEL